MADDKVKGLKAENHSRWISNGISIDDGLRIIIEQFLVGTPSCDLSRIGRDLFSYYQYKHVDDYVALWNVLVGNISDVVLYPNYQELGEGLTNHKWLGFVDLPERISEAVHLYICEYKSDKLYRSHFIDLPAVKNKGATNEERQKAAEPKRNILYVNQLFFHLRNSLAHGCFSILKQDNQQYYVFQDENQNHIMSARMVLSNFTLTRWITLLRDRENIVNT